MYFNHHSTVLVLSLTSLIQPLLRMGVYMEENLTLKHHQGRFWIYFV